MKKLVLLASVLSSSLFVTSCNSDNSTPKPSPNPSKEGIIKTQADLNPAKLQGSVEGNVTLTADKVWHLTGELSVKEGFTLTIEKGTKVEAAVGGTNVFIAIKRGAKINATGTADKPIVFTSAAAVKRSGDWGGLILAGKAKNNKGDNVTTEVGGISYGGNDDADSSGVLKYVIAKYTGARINNDKEFNGITFYSVGSGTVVENIAVMNGDDDGVEFFGGAVNVKNVYVQNMKDDMFDWTDGYTGTMTNLYGIREKGYVDRTEDPRGIEGDSNKDNNAAKPVSNPTINNVTIINNASIELTDGIKVRRGSGAQITNAFLEAGEDSEGFKEIVDLHDGGGDAAASTNISFGGENINPTDINNPVPTAMVEFNAENTGTDGSLFAWATK